ncbi:MAG TPA: EAL domain-containing protein, partial [Thermoanaerobaculaceae bacterium]|nr:EAL domain-containing protein [Thermoanaerobaculaceae bacterium]
MSGAAGPGLPVLLLEQNLRLREILVDALRGRGHQVTVCEDVETAWDAYQQQHHPIVMLALRTKRGDGLALGQRIRELPDGRASVLIFVVEQKPADGLLPLLGVADDCLTKPLRDDVVEMRIAAAERLAGERAERKSGEAERQSLKDKLSGLQGYSADEPGASEARPGTGLRGRVRRIAASLGLVGESQAGGAAPEAPPVAPPQPGPPEAAGAQTSIGNGAPAPAPPDQPVTVAPPPATSSPDDEPLEEGLTDGWWDWDLTAKVVTYSPQWKAMLGFRPREIGSSPDEWLRRVHPEDRDQLTAAIDAHLEGHTPHIENEHRLERHDGSYASMRCRALVFRDGSGKPVRITGSHTDITEQRGVDLLTGLPNRGSLIERLGRALERARAGDGSLSAVLFMDLDRFKNINYSLGHRIGDQLLKAVAVRLRSCLRGQDGPERLGTAVAHVGGDEFAVLLEGISEVNDAVRVAKRIQDELQEPFQVEGHEVFTSTSIGIAVSTPDYDRPEDLLRDADTAMFRAKALGKASYVVFDDAMHVRAVSLLKLETELRRAVQREEFRVHYQPIVLLEDGRITGFEALVRWQHPDGELLFPKDFLTVAEETGLIIGIDRQVVRDVCKQLRSWTAQFRRTTPLTVSVNVSGVQFLRPDMIVEIDRTLRNYGVYGRNLKLEITESVIMEHARYAADMLQQLKALDIKLSIDDFGTGYSSLSYLRRFEIDTLKVDFSFVNRIDTDEESWEIIRTIVTLGNNLGKDVVAEGIERGKQRELLMALRCKYGQGYFFSRPVDAEAAT